MYNKVDLLYIMNIPFYNYFNNDCHIIDEVDEY